MKKLMKAVAALMLTLTTFCVVGSMNAQTYNGHAYVDLGLPSGTLWATCNVGADYPWEYGNYYAWGETKTKITYDWNTYKYANSSDDNLTKYCNQRYYGNKGFTDNRTTLQARDDAAKVNWGNGWRTPSKAQWDELLSNTTRQWTTRNGVQGRLFTSKKNGQSLFLPAAGVRNGTNFFGAGVGSAYMSSSLYTDNPGYAWSLYSSDCECKVDGYSRGYGISVRPVREN